MLTGRVVDNNENPVENASVVDVGTGRNRTTQADGEFDLGSFDEAGIRELLITRDNFKETRVTVAAIPSTSFYIIPIDPGSGSEVVDLTAVPTIIDLSVHSGASPVGGALVEINGTVLQTGADGTLRLEVSAGEFTMTVTAPGLSSGTYTYLFDGRSRNIAVEILPLAPKVLKGDRAAIKDNLSICGVVITAMSVFILYTGVSSFTRRRFWVVVVGTLFGSVFMLVTFQYGIVLGLLAFGILLFSRREFE
jgi:hypothetical protein